ncbi:MAG TPA: hypothetical protein VII52_04330 [Gemmatimonadaceae bacterium]
MAAPIALSSDELRAVGRGDPVVRILPTKDDRDVAVFGIVAIAASREAVASSLADESASPPTGRAAVGTLRDPAVAADFAGVVLSRRDAGSLRNCRPGSCAFKLAAGEMARLRTILDRSDDTVQALRFEQRRLATIANEYRQFGNDAMPVYDDYDSRSVRGGPAFAALVVESPNLYRFAPGLREYLLGYPRVLLPGSSNELYWVREELPGMRPTTILNHRIAYSPGGVPGVTIVATKEIVADHYLEAALEVAVVIDQPFLTGRGVCVMFMRRYRFDQIPRAFGISLRGRVVAKLRDRAMADLLRERNRFDVVPAATHSLTAHRPTH